MATVLQRTVDFKPHYELVHELGKGIFGTTQLVTEPLSKKCTSPRSGGHERLVEKRIPVSNHSNFSNWKILLKSLDNIKRLQSTSSFGDSRSYEEMGKRHVVHYDKITVYDGHLCLYMEYCLRGNLKGKVDGQHGRPFPEQVIVDYVYHTVFGLYFLHKNGIVHGYLKPNNILFDRNDVLKISDYFTYQAEEKFHFEHHAHGLENDPFAAPERRAHSPATWMSDMWSLGRIFYYIFTLRWPCLDDDYLNGIFFAWLRRILDGILQRDLNTRKDCEWILRMLKQVPSDEAQRSALCSQPSVDMKHVAAFMLRTDSGGKDCHVKTFYLTATSYWTEAVNVMQHDERKQLVAHWSSCVIPLRGREVLLVDTCNRRAYYTNDVLRGRWIEVHAPQKRRWNAVGVVKDNSVFLIGGSGSGHFNDAIATVECLSLGGCIQNNRWSTMNSLPQPVVMPSAFICPQTNRVIVAGGWRGTDAVGCVQTLNSHEEWRLYPNVFSPGDSVLSGCVNEKTQQMLICFKERIAQLEYDAESKRHPYATRALCDKTLVSSHSMCIWRKQIIIGMADTVFFLDQKSGDVESSQTLPIGDGHKRCFVMSFD